MASKLSGGTEGIPSQFSHLLQALEHSPSFSYILDSQLRIVYCNPGWNRFVECNGAPELTREEVVGSDVFGSIPDTVKAFYSDAFSYVLSRKEVWEGTYECNSATFFHMHRMRVRLLKPKNWFLVTNALHSNSGGNDASAYATSGRVIICAQCRCARRVDNPNQWDFVPEYTHPRLNYAIVGSEELCPVCSACLAFDATNSSSKKKPLGQIQNALDDAMSDS
jgi:hypothetical protein